MKKVIMINGMAKHDRTLPEKMAQGNKLFSYKESQK